MNFSVYLIPVLVLFLLFWALVKKVPAYDAFVSGANEAVPLAVKLLPYLAAVFIMVELLDKSGVFAFLEKVLAPVLTFLGIPPALSGLLIVRPFSGSGSLVVLADIFDAYGADSAIGRCAAVVYGSSETVFYVSALYFAGSRKQHLLFPVLASLGIGFLSAVFGCFLIRIGL